MKKTRRKFLKISAGILAALLLISSKVMGWSFWNFGTRSKKKVLKVAAIPVEDQLKMMEKLKPMFLYLEKRIGYTIKPYLVGDYSAVIEALINKKVDIAVLGPFSYVSAHARDSAIVPFAVGVRADTHTTTYHSIIVVTDKWYKRGIKNLSSLKSHAKEITFAFVDPKSTSGYLIPKAALLEAGINPDKDFKKIVFSGGHDAVEFAIKHDQVDAGADADVTYNRLLKEGKISANENIIIWKSKPLPVSPWVYRDDLPQDLKKRIKEAFYSMPSKYAMSYGNAVKFVPAKHKDYIEIEKAAKRLGIL